MLGSKSLYCFRNALSVSFSVCDQHDLVDSLVNAISWQMRSVSFCEYLAPFFLLRITWDCVLKKSRNIFAKKVMNGESLVEVEAVSYTHLTLPTT